MVQICLYFLAHDLVSMVPLCIGMCTCTLPVIRNIRKVASLNAEGEPGKGTTTNFVKIFYLLVYSSAGKRKDI